MYQFTPSPSVVFRQEDNAWVPVENQKYLEWLAEGNTTLPAPAVDWRTPIWLDYKARREVYLNRLTGISGRATRQGLPLVAAAADAFAQGMLDLPSHSSVQAAVTPTADSLNLAILTQYKALVAIARATPETVIAFNKVSA